MGPRTTHPSTMMRSRAALTTGLCTLWAVPAKSQALTVIVSGMIAEDPHQGGATWAVLQYVLGLERLGHRVYVIEPVRRSKLQPEGVSAAGSINAAYFSAVVSRFGLAERAAMLIAGSHETVGL